MTRANWQTTWPTAATNPGRRSERERCRITVQPRIEQTAAIKWLSRCPCPDRLPTEFKQLANKPVRVIALELSGDQIRRLPGIQKRLAEIETPPS